MASFPVGGIATSLLTGRISPFTVAWLAASEVAGAPTPLDVFKGVEGVIGSAINQNPEIGSHLPSEDVAKENKKRMKAFLAAQKPAKKKKNNDNFSLDLARTLGLR